MPIIRRKNSNGREWLRGRKRFVLGVVSAVVVVVLYFLTVPFALKSCEGAFIASIVLGIVECLALFLAFAYIIRRLRSSHAETYAVLSRGALTGLWNESSISYNRKGGKVGGDLCGALGGAESSSVASSDEAPPPRRRAAAAAAARYHPKKINEVAMNELVRKSDLRIEEKGEEEGEGEGKGDEEGDEVLLVEDASDDDDDDDDDDDELESGSGMYSTSDLERQAAYSLGLKSAIFYHINRSFSRRCWHRCGLWSGCVCLTIVPLLVGILSVLLVIGFTHTALRGTRQLQGLDANVDIQRDAHGVIHVTATTEHDLMFAQAVAAAQNRLWQMEFQRRLGYGRLSELIGPETLEIDRYFRMFDFSAAADAALAHLSPRALSLLDAYVQGLNAYISSEPMLQLEFRALRLSYNSIDTWVARDVIVFSKVMAWRLSGNDGDERRRQRLRNVYNLTDDEISMLLPSYPSNGPTIVDDDDLVAAGVELKSATLANNQRRRLATTKTTTTTTTTTKTTTKTKDTHIPHRIDAQELRKVTTKDELLHTLVNEHRLQRLLDRFLPSSSSMEASNNWVVSGSRTRSGRPLLANDPHLGLGVPDVWLLMHLKLAPAPDVDSVDGYELIGATFPGTPGIVLGHNGFAAWGVTNVGADVQDFYALKVNELNESEYWYKGAWRAFDIKLHTIRIRNADKEVMRVRSCVYGPVVTDVVDYEGMKDVPYALRWTALDDDDRTMDAFLGVNMARSFAQFREALRHLVSPAQNFVYADVDGNIGYQTTGRVPIRVANHTGALPVVGDGSYDWQGFIPFDQMPRSYNPERGYIVSANNRVASSRYPNTLLNDADWAPPHRAARISQLLNASTTHTVDSMIEVQLDRVSLLFLRMKSVLKSMADAGDSIVVSARSSAWLKRLLAFDGDLLPTSVDASVWAAWYIQLISHLKPVTGEDLWYQPMWLVQNYVNASLDAPCPFTTLFNSQRSSSLSSSSSCLQLAANSLDAAVQMLADVDGGGDNVRPWSHYHRAIFDHPVLKASPLACFYRRIASIGGDMCTVNVGPYRYYSNASDANHVDNVLFPSTHAPSYRQIISLGDLDESLFVLPLGQSGDLFRSEFDNFLDKWKNGRYISMSRRHYRSHKNLQLLKKK